MWYAWPYPTSILRSSARRLAIPTSGWRRLSGRRQNKIPVVSHRRNSGEWLAILPMAHFVNILHDGPLHHLSNLVRENQQATTTNK
jgi:hypothetical protein